MFSKWVLRLLCLSLAFQQLSCTPKLGEDPPPMKNLGMETSPCLDQAANSIGEFFRGEAKESELSGAWGCFSSAFVEFKKYVRGRSSDRYTPQELATFIEDNFIEKNILSVMAGRISVGLQKEFMKIKVILIGGSQEYLTRSELDDVVKLLGEFRRMSLYLNPSMKILTMNWQPDFLTVGGPHLEEFERANTVIQEFAKDFAAIVKKNNPSYNLNDFPAILREMEKYYSETWDWLPDLERFMPLVKKVKKAVAGGDDSYVSPSEWRIFVLLGSRAYIQFLRYNYFISKSPEDSGIRMAYVARTFEDILAIFQDLVADKPTGQVSRMETGELLQAISQAWPGFKTSDNFLFEAMKLKRLVVGGSVEYWSTKDFETAKLKVNKLKDLVERLMTYYKVYGGDWKISEETPDHAESFFKEARVNVTDVLKEFGGTLEGSYSAQDLISLLSEVEKLYPSEEIGEPLHETIRSLSCLGKDIKRTLFDERKVGERCTYAHGQPENWTIEKDQWARLLELVSKVYAGYLHFHYFVEDKGMVTMREMQNRAWFGSDSVQLLQDLLNRRKNPVLTTEELSTWALDVREAGILPEEMKPATLTALAHSIVEKIMNTPEDRLKGVIPAGINEKLLVHLFHEFNMWSKTDMFFLDLYEKKQVASLTAPELLAEVEKGITTHKNDAQLLTGLQEMKMTLDTPVPMPMDAQGRVMISNQKDKPFSLDTMKTSNLSRLITRSLIRSYGLNLNRIVSYQGVQKCEAEKAYYELGGALVDIGALDPLEKSFISSRFVEANIFMPHSDGNNLMSFVETHDTAMMIFSGFEINESLKKDLLKDCVTAQNPTAETVMTFQCLRNSYRKNIVRDFPSMPEYIKYFQKVEPGEWNNSFYDNIKAAGYVPNNQNLVNLADASLFPHVIQYTEMLFSKIDRNKDGVISKSDALYAFPSFRQLLFDLAEEQIKDGQIKEKDLEAVFTYIVKYGKIPSCNKSPALLCLFDSEAQRWLKWKAIYKTDEATIYADRAQVAKILGLIADQVSNSEDDSSKPEQCGN